MKKIFLSIVLVLVGEVCHAACTGSSPNWYSSADRTSVAACVSSATYNDTINVSSGTETWSSQIEITKGIKIVGAGSSATIVTCTDSIGCINYIADSTTTTNNYVFELRGFSFNGNNTSDRHIRLANSSTSRTATVAIGNNIFKNGGGSGYNAVFVTYGQIRGVIYNNTIDRCNLLYQVLGLDTQSEWETFSFAYGSSDNLYFEDNTMGWSSSGSYANPGWVESGHAGRIAVRYNTWNLQNVSPGELWDIHGSQYHPGGMYGTMVAEFYGNTITNTPGSIYFWTHHRGSWGLYFNNLTTGSDSAYDMSIEMSAYEGGCDEDVPGSFTTEVNNTYVWNCTANGTMVDVNERSDYCGIAENSNWWVQNNSCTGSSCSAGVGRGTTAPTGSCTSGVGFWVASNSGYTTDSSIIQAGKFYKCVGGSWQEYYTPYTYPHPLRDSTTGLVIPRGVRGLRVNLSAN